MLEFASRCKSLHRSTHYKTLEQMLYLSLTESSTMRYRSMGYVLAARKELMVRRSPGSLPQLVTMTVTRRPSGARSQCWLNVAGGGGS